MTGLLPPHLSELERDIDAALARIGDIELPMATLWDPWNCPAQVLPVLAWAVSIDQWRTAWPEAQKRRMVAQSLDVHRIKGTRRAVDLAVAGFGLRVVITEWFDAEPPMPPGTCRVDIYSFNDAVSEELANEVFTAIENAKRKSIHLIGFSLNLQSRATAYAGCAALTGESIRVYPWQPASIPARTWVRLAVGARLQEVVRVYPEVV